MIITCQYYPSLKKLSTLLDNMIRMMGSITCIGASSCKFCQFSACKYYAFFINHKIIKPNRTYAFYVVASLSAGGKGGETVTPKVPGPVSSTISKSFSSSSSSSQESAL
mmetsp:Transcript_19719/g.39036  ORF Transcript_19719/g.39036 Transcript_19719/m.39036 type:complete len:109 (-) Transcript_19719:1678-2004(-)